MAVIAACAVLVAAGVAMVVRWGEDRPARGLDRLPAGIVSAVVHGITRPVTIGRVALAAVVLAAAPGLAEAVADILGA